MDKHSGIYSITNLITGDTYIGSAVCIKSRWQRHRRDLGKGIHHSRFMQRSWLKYGRGNFEFKIIEECSPEMLITIEDAAIKSLKPKFNSCPSAGSPMGRIGSIKEREFKSRYAREHGIQPPREYAISKRKRVDAMNKETGELIKSFDSISMACQWAGRTYRFVSCITSCCNGGRYKTFCGFKWRWSIAPAAIMATKPDWITL